MFVVMARTDRAQASHGISAIIVERIPGVSRRKEGKKLGALPPQWRTDLYRLPGARRQLIGKQGEDSSIACAF
jgi:alkylation response protein AidB-like acyl-CoA dehydrogenase